MERREEQSYITVRFNVCFTVCRSCAALCTAKVRDLIQSDYSNFTFNTDTFPKVTAVVLLATAQVSPGTAHSSHLDT